MIKPTKVLFLLQSLKTVEGTKSEIIMESVKIFKIFKLSTRLCKEKNKTKIKNNKQQNIFSFQFFSILLISFYFFS